jgi:cytochrome oxidase Cu insertion factor (SCO1/SenC/PrrC family)
MSQTTAWKAVFSAAIGSAFLATLVPIQLRGAVVQDLAPQTGKTVASINWIDEIGRNRNLSEFAGYPVILLPIYTRCKTACIQNVSHLANALGDSPVDPRQFRVFLFSFDETDTPAALAEYRLREKIPLGWSIGTATPRNIEALMESIGFQYGRAGREFAHANLLVFLDSKLRIAKWIYGTGYSGRDVDLALKIASGESDWIGQHSQSLYALLLLGGSLLCVSLLYHASQWIRARQLQHRADHAAAAAEGGCGR